MAINPLSGTGNQTQPIPTLPTPQNTSRTQIPGATVAPSSGTTANAQTNSPQSTAEIQQAVDKIQDSVDKLAQNLQFSIDNDTGKTIIKVMDAHTQEVIRQIPTEEAVSIARTLDKVQGLLFNDKA